MRRWVLAVCVLLFVGSGTTALLQAAYSPYEFVRFSAVPPVACPGEEVYIGVERTIETVWSVQRIDVAGQWQDRAGKSPPVVISSATAYPDRDYLRSGRVAFPVDTPPTAGRWTLITEIHASGRVLGLPTTQTVEAKTRNVLTILPQDSEACAAKLGQNPKGGVASP